MTLKAATLIAIIGNLLSFIGVQILQFGNFQFGFDNRMTMNIIWCGIGLLSTGSLLVFLFTLYAKQK